MIIAIVLERRARRELLPRIKRNSPRLTGALARSLRVKKIRDNAIVIGAEVRGYGGRDDGVVTPGEYGYIRERDKPFFEVVTNRRARAFFRGAVREILRREKPENLINRRF